MFKKRKVNENQQKLNIYTGDTTTVAIKQDQTQKSAQNKDIRQRIQQIGDGDVRVGNNNDDSASASVLQAKKIYDNQAAEQNNEILQQPRKRVKMDFTGATATAISASTSQRKQENQDKLHKQFKSLNYSAKQQSTPADQSQINTDLILEEQLAKQKYMQNIKITKQIKEGQLDTSVYRGKNGYANYALTQDQIVNAQEKYRKIAGPSRVSSTIRNTCRFDYNFGLCKDWHDSGYCPFGDSCLYLHDRSNYKTGWEQEKDFELAEKQRWRRINNPELSQKQQLEESLKSIEKYKVVDQCGKCKKQFKSPVQVDCGHIFCTSCAIKLEKCPQCKKKLCGIMNNAQKRLKKMKETYEELKAKIMKENEQNKVKRRNNLDQTSSLKVFED